MATAYSGVVALVPAHDEADRIASTLDSLRAQTLPVERVVVVADNCTDATAQVARSRGAEVVETVDNLHKKAGALNQALAELLPRLGPEALVLVMDADSALDPRFLETAVARLGHDEGLGAVGGVFYGEPGGGLLGQLQRNEYARYARDIARHSGRVMVLTGTAAVFRPAALRDVARARGGTLAGTPGAVYDTLALTEDNEITLALKTLGWRLVSPRECRVTTEIMPTWGDLWRQRMRWQRGAVENLRTYGWTPVTRRYWGQQAAMGLGVLALNLYAVLTVLALLAQQRLDVSPFWLAIGGVFVVEKVVTAWREGWPGRLLALPMLPELAYDLFLQAVYARSVHDVLRGKEARWHHVVRGGDSTCTESSPPALPAAV